MICRLDAPQQMSARDALNIIRQRHELILTYHEFGDGPAHLQAWHGVWILEGVGEIGRGTAGSKTGAKEEAARMAVIWLLGCGY
jgi:hypothetical protein